MLLIRCSRAIWPPVFSAIEVLICMCVGSNRQCRTPRGGGSNSFFRCAACPAVTSAQPALIIAGPGGDMVHDEHIQWRGLCLDAKPQLSLKFGKDVRDNMIASFPFPDSTK